MAQLVYENPTMCSLIERGANVRFLGSRTRKMEEESPLLGIQQGPIGGANNICFIVILPNDGTSSTRIVGTGIGQLNPFA